MFTGPPGASPTNAATAVPTASIGLAPEETALLYALAASGSLFFATLTTMARTARRTSLLTAPPRIGAAFPRSEGSVGGALVARTCSGSSTAQTGKADSCGGHSVAA
jgi:hypothetical protein